MGDRLTGRLAVVGFDEGAAEAFSGFDYGADYHGGEELFDCGEGLVFLPVGRGV